VSNQKLKQKLDKAKVKMEQLQKLHAIDLDRIQGLLRLRKFDAYEIKQLRKALEKRAKTRELTPAMIKAVKILTRLGEAVLASPKIPGGRIGGQIVGHETWKTIIEISGNGRSEIRESIDAFADVLKENSDE